MKFLPITVLFLLNIVVTSAQVYKSTYTFIDYQRSFPRINQALQRVEDNLIRDFQEKGLAWPAKYLYIRSFKYDSQLEVWIKYNKAESFQLFKTYRVCALSGKLGPKRMKGDYQVPEGFYYINEFNPNSTYHLSLGLNYPNASDRILADSLIPGGDIYIHGSCVTTGCIPITNDQIEELYILASHARNLGQDFIPVHIFPIRYDNYKSVQFLNRFLKESPEYVAFNDQLCNAYEYFQQTRRLPLVMVNSTTGSYLLEPDQKEIEPVASVTPPRVSSMPQRQNPESSVKTGSAQ